MKKYIKNLFLFITIILLHIATILLMVGCSEKEESILLSKEEYEEALRIAQTTPDGKYPQLITYTLGKMTGNNNSNMPQGDTYENNAYTRYLNELLNIQNKNIFEAKDDQYFTTVNMAIATDNLPDIMIVEDVEAVVALAEKGLIEDLTQAYNNCTSSTIKEIYDSYGKNIFEGITIDGKLMAIPETSISEGPNLIWLRKDWMDLLGLEEPKNIQDVEAIIREFITKNPGNNEFGETIGLVSDTTLCGENGYSSEYQLDIIFATFGAYPKQWMRNEKGEIIYGSIQPEAKEALEYIHSLYEEGILDPNFILRTNINIIDLIVEGKCGSFFGPWWAPNNPLMDAMAKDSSANWQPYLLETDENGYTTHHSQHPTYKYVVVKKGYEYPEIVTKMLSIIFDYSRYVDVDNEEISNYFQLNVDPTARPIAINVDYKTALNKCYDTIMDAFEGRIEVEQMPLLERSYYTACKSYLEKKENPSLEEWAAYQSRIVACSLLKNDKIKVVESLFFGDTKSMKDTWWRLKELESQAYLKIICGEEEISYFDTYVEEWLTLGGLEILEEVEAKIN